MPFVKGQSGNPSGRPKILGEMMDLAKKYTKDNIERIADLAANSEDDNVRLRASIALHEIAWGKPAQAVTGEGGGPVALAISWLQPSA